MKGKKLTAKIKILAQKVSRTLVKWMDRMIEVRPLPVRSLDSPRLDLEMPVQLPGVLPREFSQGRPGLRRGLGQSGASDSYSNPTRQ